MFFLYLSQFLGTMTCIRRAVLHIRPLRAPKGVPFLPVSVPFLTLTSLDVYKRQMQLNTCYNRIMKGVLIMKLAERIQYLRKMKGISQEELAEKAGVSRQAVSKWESDQSTPCLLYTSRCV